MKKTGLTGFAKFILAAILPATILAAQADPITPISKADRDAYAELSPFEFKNLLIEKASAAKPSVILNAGRGNPNFINTRARLAFSMLHRFAVTQAAPTAGYDELGFPLTSAAGMADKFKIFLSKETDKKTTGFLQQCLDYSRDELDIAPDQFVFDMVDAVLGDHYPTPSRMLITPEKVVNAYLKSIHFTRDNAPAGDFDLFATEGATAAMIYVFKTLKENFLLMPGDSIAIITPVFSPYLEIPVLNDYKLQPVYVEGLEGAGWQVSDRELEKLKDKDIKALFMVNPMNPGAVSMNSESVEKIAAIIRAERSDLIVLTDTVYCPFVDEFHDLLEAVPENCIGVFSYSKYFGVTGWRLGVVFIHRENVFDRMIAELSAEQQKLLYTRYLIDSTDPQHIPFIERLLMDSRDVALAHTGGLATPQQCAMALFALFDLTDTNKTYKQNIQALLKKRMANLYQSLDIEPPSGAGQTMYYNMINIKNLAERRYGREFADQMTLKYSPFDFLLQLAGRYKTVLLPGVGFAGPEWSVRVSLANLPDEDYTKISKNISNLLDEFAEQPDSGAIKK